MANIEDFDPTIFEPNYEEKTYPIRGKIIAHFAMFEKNIEAVLAAEFSAQGEVRRKMQNIIFDRMTFENKKNSSENYFAKQGNPKWIQTFKE